MIFRVADGEYFEVRHDVVFLHMAEHGLSSLRCDLKRGRFPIDDTLPRINSDPEVSWWSHIAFEAAFYATSFKVNSHLRDKIEAWKALRV